MLHLLGHATFGAPSFMPWKARLRGSRAWAISAVWKAPDTSIRLQRGMLNSLALEEMNSRAW